MEYEQLLLRDIKDSLREADSLLSKVQLSTDDIAKLEEALHKAQRDAAQLYGSVVSKQYRNKK